LSTSELHHRLKQALGVLVLRADGDDVPVLTLEAAAPLPPRLRVYLFNATNPPGGRVTAEHKIQLRVPGQARDQRGNFDFSDERNVIMAGYSDDDDVFVLWDSSLHHDFTWSKNVQVKTATVDEARAGPSVATQQRRVRLGDEIVLAARPQFLAIAIQQRFAGAAPPPPEPEPAPPPIGGGQPYTPPTRGVPAEPPEALVFEVDPDLIDRGTTAHKDIQDGLAAALQAHGLQPLSPLPGDPLFDIAWVVEGLAFIGEVKSLTLANEERQLRLGLGQVLTYMHLLDWPHAHTVRGVLAVEREPTAPYWETLCAEHDVTLTWPDAFEELFVEPQ
jgi:hypothetical protein